MTYSFQDQLKISKGVSQENDLHTIRYMLDGCVDVSVASLALDKRGVDYVATLRGGAQVMIDAKTRAQGCSRFWQNGPELAIEKWSVVPGGKYKMKGKTGWTLDEAKLTHMILYTFHDSDCRSAYLLPFQSLRMAALRNISAWFDLYKVDQQDSGRWQSEAVFVPAEIVIQAMQDTYSSLDFDCEIKEPQRSSASICSTTQTLEFNF